MLIQYIHATWHAAWTSSMDMQHEDVDMKPMAYSTEMQHGHAVWICCVHLQRENAAWGHVHEAGTVSMEMQLLHQNEHEN
jgi:hypothetical protein